MKRTAFDFTYTAVCLLGLFAFWLPWIKTGFLGDYNGYHIFRMAFKSSAAAGTAVLLLPLLFAALAVIRLVKPRFFSEGKVKILEILTLIMALFPNAYLIVRTARRPGVELKPEHFQDFFGYGMVILLACSLFLAFTPRFRKRRAAPPASFPGAPGNASDKE